MCIPSLLKTSLTSLIDNLESLAMASFTFFNVASTLFFGILLQLLILGTPHSKSVTIHKDNLQPRIDKRRNRTFARRTRQKKTKVRKWRDKRALLCRYGDGNLADYVETAKQRAQGNGMQLSKMMEWEIWGLRFLGWGRGVGERLGAEVVAASRS